MVNKNMSISSQWYISFIYKPMIYLFTYFVWNYNQEKELIIWDSFNELK